MPSKNVKCLWNIFKNYKCMRNSKLFIHLKINYNNFNYIQFLKMSWNLVCLLQTIINMYLLSYGECTYWTTISFGIVLRWFMNDYNSVPQNVKILKKILKENIEDLSDKAFLKMSIHFKEYILGKGMFAYV